ESFSMGYDERTWTLDGRTSTTVTAAPRIPIEVEEGTTTSSSRPTRTTSSSREQPSAHDRRVRPHQPRRAFAEPGHAVGGGARAGAARSDGPGRVDRAECRQPAGDRGGLPRGPGAEPL